VGELKKAVGLPFRLKDAALFAEGLPNTPRLVLEPFAAFRAREGRRRRRWPQTGFRSARLIGGSADCVRLPVREGDHPVEEERGRQKNRQFLDKPARAILLSFSERSGRLGSRVPMGPEAAAVPAGEMKALQTATRLRSYRAK